MDYFVKEYIEGHNLQTIRDLDSLFYKEHTYSNYDIIYYYDKFVYLKSKGFFNDRKIGFKFQRRLMAKDITRSIANCKLIALEITEKCNLNCSYCIYGEMYNHYDERNFRNLELKKAYTLIDYFLNLWTSDDNDSFNDTKYISFYGGEPLLNFELITKIVDYVKISKNKFKVDIAFSMTTNAVLLNRYIDYFVKNNFFITLSIDGDDISNQYRVFKNGRRSFDIVFNNIINIKRQYPEYFDKYITINSVYHRDSNYFNVSDFIYKQFGKKPKIAELNPTLINGIRNDLFKSVYDGLNKEELNNIYFSPQNVSDFLSLITDSYGSYSNLLCKSRDSLPTGTCVPFSKKIFVTVSGKILPCETIPHKYSIGSVTEKEVIIDFNEVAALYNNFYDNITKQCKKCYNYMNCKLCVLLSLKDPYDICPQYKSKERFSMHISPYIEYFENNPKELQLVYHHHHNNNE